MIVIPSITPKTPLEKGKEYSAIVGFYDFSEPDFNGLYYYLSDGIFHNDGVGVGAVALIDVKHYVHIPLSQVEERDLRNNVSGIETVNELLHTLKSTEPHFDSRMIVTLFRFKISALKESEIE